jgi:hypothetical protein
MSQVVAGISVWFVVFLWVSCLSQGRRITIEYLVQFEKIATDIYKVLQQIVVRELWMEYGTFFVLFNFEMLRFPESEISGSVDNLKNTAEHKKIKIFMIINYYTTMSTLMYKHGCNRKFCSTFVFSYCTNKKKVMYRITPQKKYIH